MHVSQWLRRSCTCCQSFDLLKAVCSMSFSHVTLCIVASIAKGFHRKIENRQCYSTNEFILMTHRREVDERPHLLIYILNIHLKERPSKQYIRMTCPTCTNTIQIQPDPATYFCKIGRCRSCQLPRR